MIRYRILLLLVFSALLTGPGCAIPLISKKNQVEKTCEYREVFSVATIQSMEGGAITFEVSGYREVEREISTLPTRFSYNLGDEFNVRQQFLTRGNCEEYKFDLLQKL